VAAEARPLRLRGKADRETFRIVQERIDVESALSVPLIHEGVVLGVLNLHHTTRADAFSESDLEFMEQLAHLDAQIIARAQEHAVMRLQATRYQAAREVNQILSGTAPLQERLTKLCHHVCERAGGGISNIYQFDADDADLSLTATSLGGGGMGGEYRIALGRGIDGRVATTRDTTFLHASDGSLAYAALPLVVGNDLAGVLSVQIGHEQPVTPFLEEVLAEVASAAAEEILTVSRQARLAERSVKVSAINDTGIRMISTTDPADVLRLGASGAAMALEADHAILRLQDDQTHRYVIRSYFGSADGRQQEKLFRLDRTLSVDAIKRRGAVLVREISESEAYREYECGIRSVMSAPLKREGRVIGTLSLYDKVIADRFTTGSFSDEDLNMFTKFVSYLERAVVNALFYAEARRHQNYDEDTGLPDMSYLKQRSQEEITRAGNRENALTLCTCRVENLQEIEQASDPARGRAVIQRTAEALKSSLRSFDVLTRSSDDGFTILLPEPGNAPSERVFTMARAVADEVAKDDSLNDPVRVALAFGYAVFPSEGEDVDSLMTRAGAPRIRMV
jgi:diguanylate cyclase (GGDEF)-like protein